MNPESLDSSIQGALAALYPPFEATAPTVLSQLFRVIEESYQGDALQCLLDFLIPAKHILESVQQAACAPYSDVVFRCEGWPLCLRERVVIQLASLNPLLLRPGDFYLQVAPFADQAARIVLKSLLEEHRVEVEETPVPETSYPCIFTQDWLREVNHGRHGTPLHRCLLATDQGIVKVPWEEVARPEFVDRPRAMASPPEGPPRPLPRNAAAAAAPTSFAVETRILPAKDGIAVSLRLVDGGCPRLARADRARPARKPVGWVAPNTWDSRHNRDLEGDYVDLVDFNKEKEALALNRVSSQPKNLTPPLRPVRPAPPAPPPRGPLPVPCGRTAKFSEEPCTPCMRRRLAQDLQSADPQSPDLRCRYRESYLAALQNPVTLERGEKMRAVLEEPGCPEEGGGGPGRAPPPPPPPLCCQPGRPCHAPAAERPVAADRPVAGDDEEGDAGLRRAAERKGRPLSPSPSAASEPGRRFVLVQRSSGRSHSDVYPEMIPHVHVLQCKKSTAFGLVSPKTDRRRYGKQALIHIGHAEAQTPPLLINGQKKLQTLPGEGPRGPPGDHAPSPRSWGPLPASLQDPSSSLLHLGVACLPGSRDRTGRAVLEVYGDHKGWMSPFLSSQELCKLLLYFHSLPRKEVRDLGMTVVTDARKTPPPPAFYKSLLMVQEQALHAVHCVLMLVDKETNPRPERQPGLQMDVVTSLKALHKTVEGHQLTSALEGTYAYSHSDWLQLYQKLDPFVLHLQEASGLLQKAIGKVEGASKIDTVQDVQQCINEQKAMMREVLEDAQLVTLQREGGAMLARLRREEFRFSHSEDYRDAMDLASGLYNQVEEQVHKLVMRSNQSLQHLDFLLKLRQLEGRFIQIREWFNAEGERRLLEAESVEDSLERVERTLDSFNTFLTQANEQKHQAMTLVTEAEKIQGASYPETEVFRTMVYTFKSSLADFLSRAELCRAELETMATLCRFCERATELAKDCRQYLEQSQPGGQSGADVQSALQGYRQRFAEFSAERFQEAKARACSLKGSRGMRVWNVAWLRSQEVWGQLEERLSDPGPSQRPVAQPEAESGGGVREEAGSPAPPAGASPPLCGPGGPGSAGSPGGGPAQESDYGTVTCFKMSFRPDSKNGKGAKGTPFSGNGFEGPVKKEERRSAGGLKEMTIQEAVGNVDFGQKERSQPFGRSLSEGSSAGSVRSEPPAPPSARTRGQPSSRILLAAQSFQISRHGSFCSEDLGGVVPADDRQEAGPCVRRCPATASLATEEEGGSNNLKLQRIMEELLLTEREYVRSLGYIMAHYYPLLETPDVPQDLRGQRGRIFGNLEKLHDFHRHSFLKELEGCRGEPLRVGRCFLRHKESFNLYALYSKNKPQSDSILLHHGNDFFKKQQALSDKMDLSSYLLKPVQRISKYSLLLQDMLRECSGPQRGRQRAEIQAALQAVQFQLRHGNDLLTMDDIRNCDVNLKEQGQLIRQDEFMVSFRKKKCSRHVFLFQDLILFSKTKRNDVGNDVYIYKQSFKTSDVGMTHNSGDSGLCFEIWFRRRKFQDTYILQAERAEVKDDWTRDLERILWDQAVRSREIRMQERVFMGIGRKPFMDIQPSEAAICDRAVNCILPGRECNASASSGVTSSLGDHELPRPDSIGSGSSSSTSSSSGRGSLPPTGFLCGQPQEGGHRDFSGSGALEDDLDRESEKIHLLMDSSESSGESVSGFSVSDRSCLSVTGGDADDTSSIISTLRPKKPTIAPKPQAHSAPQGPGQVQAMPASGKSTEV